MTEKPRISEGASVLARKARKRAELAFFIPVLGCLIFLSPLLDALGFGATSLARQFLAIFFLWGALIALAFMLRRILSQEIEED
ncbi:MAG: hypothetical protein AAFR98_06370 [Pseudomonadota bacterium]